jgi:pyruvate formate lyase activating enzyme
MDRYELISGIIFDIQGFSVHDGPGCRTLIFLKGCSLRCQWCSNPEGLHAYPEPLYYSEKCIHDGACRDACTQGALSLNGDRLIIEREKCQRCVVDDHSPSSFLPCASACLTSALKKAGYVITLKELFHIISRDRNYWGSEGGVTLTGGEPMVQSAFATAILKRCYDAYIHTAIETCGNVPWTVFEKALPYLNYILYDLKHMDPAKHKAMTGISNNLILDNARRLARHFQGKVVFRVPVIPGFNDDDENMIRIKEFMRETGVREIELLPLHHLGREKYRLLGTEYLMDSSNNALPGYTENLFNKYFK